MQSKLAEILTHYFERVNRGQGLPDDMRELVEAVEALEARIARVEKLVRELDGRTIGLLRMG